MRNVNSSFCRQVPFLDAKLKDNITSFVNLYYPIEGRHLPAEAKMEPVAKLILKVNQALEVNNCISQIYSF
jgi:hypothetical protein